MGGVGRRGEQRESSDRGDGEGLVGGRGGKSEGSSGRNGLREKVMSWEMVWEVIVVVEAYMGNMLGRKVSNSSGTRM